jgi:hypothetical protein
LREEIADRQTDRQTGVNGGVAECHRRWDKGAAILKEQ